MNKQEKKLLGLFQKLGKDSQEMLLSFAEFLVQRNPPSVEAIGDPVPQVVKEDESVIAAIKRLSATYPMLDKGKMLNVTSILMSQHVLQGRAKEEVIRELETVFEEHYQTMKDEQQDHG